MLCYMDGFEYSQKHIGDGWLKPLMREREKQQNCQSLGREKRKTNKQIERLYIKKVEGLKKEDMKDRNRW